MSEHQKDDDTDRDPLRRSRPPQPEASAQGSATEPDLGDEVLMAYADGELDPLASAQVARALAADPRVAARVALFRDTADAARAAFAPDLERSVPAGLLHALDDAVGVDTPDSRTSPQATLTAGVPLVPDGRSAANAGRWALAASVAAFVVGVVATLAVTSWIPSEESMSTVGGAVVADTADQHAAVIDALATLPSGERRHIAGGASVHMLASFAIPSGELCRELVVRRSHASVAAVACRVRERWTIPLALLLPSDSSFVPAGSDGPIETFLRSLGASAPLSHDAERAALATKTGKSR